MRKKEIKGEEGKTEGKVCDSILIPLIPPVDNHPVLRMVLLPSLPASSTNVLSKGIKQKEGSENRDQLQMERQLEGQEREPVPMRA